MGNPNAPNALTYAWLGPAIGSLIRPVGGILADKFGGGKCTQVLMGGMIIFGSIIANLCVVARGSEKPEEHFPAFLVCFLSLFLCTGAMNGTTFRSIAKIFPPEKAGPVLGWSSAIASYGAFVIPQLIGIGIRVGRVENPFFGLVGFYGVCFVLNAA